MADKKTIWITIAAGLLVGALLVLTAGGMYLWTANQDKKEADRLTKRIAALEKTAKEAKAEADKKKGEAAAKADPYKGWLTYENTAIGYTLKYPTDWTYEKSAAVEMDLPADYVNFYNYDKDYVFTFGLRKVGSDLVLTGRTGLGVGETQPGGNVTILGQSVEKTYYVTEGRVSVIFYGSGLPGMIVIGDNEIVAELGVPGYKDKSLQGSPQEIIADSIISSLALK
jgi:hypothetical protein